MARTSYSLRPTDVGVVYVTAGFDAEVSVDLTAPVAQGAVVSNLAAECWRFPDLTEAAISDAMIAANDKLNGAPAATGSVVRQRMTALDKGRVYRVEIAYGPAGNKRETGIIIDVSQ